MKFLGGNKRSFLYHFYHHPSSPFGKKKPQKKKERQPSLLKGIETTTSNTRFDARLVEQKHSDTTTTTC
tara:strand:- start:236 stop:442 length:207 start_codon:yes stop_codon:yes gene_type:complete